jgi:hypothetical protein
MVEAGQEPEMKYRQEVLSKFFGCIQSTDSFYLIGAPSMGKTRLMDFLMRPKVQEYYLGEQAKTTWLVRVDLNRLSATKEDWAFYFYEFLLSSLLLACISREEFDESLSEELAKLDSDVIESHDPLRALRFFEWGVSKLCQKHDLKLCFIFDEFDETYKKMPAEVFAQLRAARDANKSRLLYSMFLRNLPARLRPQKESESFYELLSRNPIGIGPYSRSDSLQIIQNLELDWELSLTPEKREKIYLASGGHPGFIKTLLSLIKDPQVQKRMDNPNWEVWFSGQETILEECMKIWNGLEKDEKEGLLAFVYGKLDPAHFSSSTIKLLTLKGFWKKGESGGVIFSSLFDLYLKSGLAKP